MSDYRSSSVEVRYGWVVVWASLVLNGIALGAPTLLFVALKPIAADLGGERWVPSFGYSLLMVGTGIGGIAMGWWMDKRGILQPILFGSAMICLGSLVASQSEGRWGFWIANGLLIGLLGKAAMIAPLVANATRWFDRRRGLAVAIIASGQGLAGAVWPTVFGYLENTVGWRETYSYYAIFAAVTMLPLCWLVRPKPPVPPPGPIRLAASRDGRVLDWPADRVQVMLWLAAIGCCGGMSMPMVHLVSHASDLGYAEARGAELLTVLMVAGFVSRMGFGVLSDRIGAAPTLLIASACQMVDAGRVRVRREPDRALYRGADVRARLRRHHAVLSAAAPPVVPGLADRLADRGAIPVRGHRYGARQHACRLYLRPDRFLRAGFPHRRRLQRDELPAGEHAAPALQQPGPQPEAGLSAAERAVSGRYPTLPDRAGRDVDTAAPACEPGQEAAAPPCPEGAEAPRGCHDIS